MMSRQRISPEKVEEMLRELRKGTRQVRVAERFKVSESFVSRLRRPRKKETPLQKESLLVALVVHQN